MPPPAGPPRPPGPGAQLRVFRSAHGAHLFVADGSRVYDLPEPVAARVERWTAAPEGSVADLTRELDLPLWGEPRCMTRAMTPRGPPTRFAQPARVVDGADVAVRMRERLAEHGMDARRADPPVGPPGWVVTARADRPPGPSTGRDAAARGERPGSPAGPRVPSRALSSSPSAPERASGRRRLLAGTAPLRPGADERTAVLGTAETGWAHLTPLGRGAALVQAMVPGPAGDPVALLARLAAETGLGALLRHPPRSAAAIPAAPLLHPAPATPPAADAPGRLLVGAGAIRYDPLSGTGTAQALRTGILAAAVIDAAARGTAAPGALCAHYSARLRAAYADHQRSCVRLYGSAFPGPAWSDELDAARAASAAGWP